MALMFVGLLSVLVLTFIWFIYPSQHIPKSADAIVVNAGGEGERLKKAVELMELGIAPLLIINRGQEDWNGLAAINQLCDRSHPEFEVRCIVAEIDSTAGEGLAFAALAEKEELSHLVLVTSNYHLFRASFWLRRYFRGTVDRVGAGGNFSIWNYVHEWGGIIKATLYRSP